MFPLHAVSSRCDVSALPIISQGLALIFDMDGVIIDSNPVHTKAWVSYLAGFGITIDNLEERMYGRRNDELVRDLFGDQVTSEEVFRHGAAKERLYRELMKPELSQRMVPGVVDFIRHAAHVPTGVGTNAEPANVAFVLEAAGLEGCFQAIVDGHRVANPKPHPEVYLRVAALLQMDPKNCIVFEDSYTGTAAASAAGARVVGVQTSHAKFPDVDLAIRDFCDPELFSWLASQRPQ
ncbi:MAG: HAD family phosphatase [Bryobacteraceae bacterium]